MRKLALVGILAMAATAGCGILDGSADSDDDSDEGDAGAGNMPGGGSGGGGGQPAPPHALGIITLGETHSASGGAVVPSVSAFFVPDAASGAAAGAGVVCTRAVGSCEMVLTADCNDTCETSQYCAFDANCEPVCQDICDLTCPEDEFCYFAAPGSPACGRVERFDAGTLVFSGTTAPVTLLPPYTFSSDAETSLFTSGALLGVSASGAAEAGFAPFQQSFTATNLFQTSPSLESIGRGEVFGDQPLTLSWVPGTDALHITITLTDAARGSATLICEADDEGGSFSVPRQALRDAVEGRALSNVMVTLTRSRTEVHRGFDTQGQLSGATVQPVGWLELVTTSTEFHNFAGCQSGLAVCGDACANLMTDRNNCGACGNACAASDYGCTNGTCAPCAPEQASCGGRCIDTSEDPLNCGACNRVCAMGTECFYGQCEECFGTCSTCPEGGFCGNGCINLDTDETHCGDCDYPCETGDRCVGGECEAGCASGTTDCNGTCVNLTSDEANCGACARACTTGQTCTNSACMGGGGGCATGLEDCGGGVCADLDTNEEHCGECDYACQSSETCLDGVCETACAGGLTDCDGFCVNLTNDEDNCGQCSYACQADEECVGGACYYL